MADKTTELLVAALRQALDAGEQRLFKSGKLHGLFAGKTGANAQAATRAVQDGLLETVRTELKGKTAIEWVKLTPRGVEFLHEHGSPTQSLTELLGALRTTRDGVPIWLADMRRALQALAEQLSADGQRWLVRLDGLSRQVEQTLRRLEADSRQLPDGAESISWALPAFGYLDHRKSAGATTPCPLPELFAALNDSQPGLSITAFHDGLKLLARRRLLRLLPGSNDDLNEPEYALPDGAELLYYVERSSS